MADPSDPAGARPINRLCTVSPSIDELVSHALTHTWVEERGKLFPPGTRSNAAGWLDDPSTIWGPFNRRELYRAVYALTRTEIALGEQPKAIRAGFREMAEELEGMDDTIFEAVEDALAGRAPRW